MTVPPCARLLRPDLARFTAYPAPEPVEAFAARLGLPVERVIKLDQNENPYGCSPRVRAALAAFDRYHQYPDPHSRLMRERLAEYAGVPAERLLVGHGSDELIELLVRLFVAPGDRVVIPSPTFGYYQTVAALAGAEIVEVPRTADFDLDLEATVQAARTAKLVFLASPNNPTGNLTPLPAVERLLASGAMVVVDEAYYEFAGQTALPLAERAENLVILRTFSKWAGLAGIRVGYGIFPAWLVPEALKVKAPFNVSLPAQVALLAALDDRAYLLETVRKIVAERERLFQRLAGLSYLRPLPSAANFILVEVRRGDPQQIVRALERQGILIRTYQTPRLARYLRISVGRPEHTEALMAVLSALEKEMAA